MFRMSLIMNTPWRGEAEKNEGVLNASMRAGGKRFSFQVFYVYLNKKVFIQFFYYRYLHIKCIIVVENKYYLVMPVSCCGGS